MTTATKGTDTLEDVEGRLRELRAEHAALEERLSSAQLDRRRSNGTLDHDRVGTLVGDVSELQLREANLAARREEEARSELQAHNEAIRVLEHRRRRLVREKSLAEVAPMYDGLCAKAAAALRQFLAVNDEMVALLTESGLLSYGAVDPAVEAWPKPAFRVVFTPHGRWAPVDRENFTVRAEGNATQYLASLERGAQ